MPVLFLFFRRSPYRGYGYDSETGRMDSIALHGKISDSVLKIDEVERKMTDLDLYSVAEFNALLNEVKKYPLTGMLSRSTKYPESYGKSLEVQQYILETPDTNATNYQEFLKIMSGRVPGWNLKLRPAPDPIKP